MPPPKTWTLVRLERACRKAFMERGRLKMKPLSVSAQVEWTDGGPIKAEIDPLTISYIAGVVHEFVHPILDAEMACFADYRRDATTGRWEEDLGELAMNAWEEALLKFISSHHRRKEWWRKAINGKLPK
jgi:hypothetical protein